MAELGSLFAQLNQAVLQNPLNQSFDFTVPGEAERPLDRVNPMLAQAAQGFGAAMGAPKDQLATSQQAVQQRQQKYRETLSKKARELGQTSLAEEIASGTGDLREQAMNVHKWEMEQLIHKRGWFARRSALKAAGVTNPDAYINATTDEIKMVIDGEKGEVKGFTNSSGNQVSLRVNDQGRVYDKNANGGVGMWRDPSEMGLSPSVQTTKVIEAGQQLAKELAKQGVTSVLDAREKALEGSRLLPNIQRSRELVNQIIAGPFANAELAIKRLGDAMGFDFPEVASTEQFIAEAGLRVAQQIKAFGSGTGLSDADREYARQIVAGEITTTRKGLERILKAYEKNVRETIGQYNTVYAPGTAKVLRAQGNEGLTYLIEPVDMGGAAADDGVPTYDPATGKWSDQ